MAKLRERNDQIEIILERRHVILLGLCALVLGSLLFLLGMLTQRNWLGAPAKLVAEARKETPPPLFPNRSTEPNVQGKDFEFYESLAGSQAKSRKDRTSRKTSEPARSGLPVVPAVATSTESSASPDAARRSASLQASASVPAKPKPADPPPPSVQPARPEPKPAPAAVKPAERAEPKLETAAKTAAKTPASPIKADKSGAYALQIIALSDKSSAQDYLKRLKSKGYPAFVDQGRLNGKLLYRVKVGNYVTLDKAQKVAAKLEAEVGKRVLVQRAAEG